MGRFKAKLAAKLTGLVRDEEGQAMTETIILVALVGLTLAWVTWALPAAIQSHYEQNRDVLTTPL